MNQIRLEMYVSLVCIVGCVLSIGYIAGRIMGLRSVFIEVILALFALAGICVLLVLVYMKALRPLFIYMKESEDMTRIYKTQKKETTFRRI